MANPLFNGFGNNQFTELVKQIQEFQKTFSGDARSIVEQMMKDGRMSQEQFNQYSQMANQLMAMMPKN